MTESLNTLEEIEDTLNKCSDSNPGKIESEYNWMQTVSQIDNLKNYIPENFKFKDGCLYVTDYDSGDLGKKLLKKVSKKDMKSIISKLINIFDDFRNVKIDENIRCDGFYSRLIKDRLTDLPLRNMFKYYLINGVIFDNINYYEVIDRCKELNLNVDIGLIHGNLLLSNVLIDGDNFRLINPVSDFSEDFSIYGDRRYDLAKLRLSLDSYNSIVNDKYSLSYKNNIVDYKINLNYDSEEALSYFDYKVKVLGYNLDDIKFIEGLLFLISSSLCKEDFERQLLYYVLAVEKLGDNV